MKVTFGQLIRKLQDHVLEFPNSVDTFVEFDVTVPDSNIMLIDPNLVHSDHMAKCVVLEVPMDNR